MEEKSSLPESLVRTNTGLHGDEGIQWLDRLPAILARFRQEWSLELGPPFPRLSYNYAAPALRADGTQAVIKVGYPGREFLTEAHALQFYGGRGAVRLLEANLEEGVLLLERLTPGTMLLEVEDDQEAMTIASSVMRELWQPAPAHHPFPTVADWARGLIRLREEFGGATGPFPARLVEEAEQLFGGLLATQAEPVVLHGDLHHFNILKAEREPWLAIDPKGVVGEPAYEVGALLRNPIPEMRMWPNLDRILARRIDQLSEELGFSRERIRDWAVAQAVLSAWWTYEDKGDNLAGDIASAELLATVKAHGT